MSIEEGTDNQELNTDSKEYKLSFELVDLICNWYDDDLISKEQWDGMNDILRKYGEDV